MSSFSADTEEAVEPAAQLELLEQKAAQLQADGDALGAITQFDQALSLKMEVFGIKSTEVISACESLALLCNTVAMQLMGTTPDRALQLLKNAELLTGPSGCLPQGETRAKLRAVTMNNLGCYFKK
jgi:hypothetical protein